MKYAFKYMVILPLLISIPSISCKREKSQIKNISSKSDLFLTQASHQPVSNIEQKLPLLFSSSWVTSFDQGTPENTLKKLKPILEEINQSPEKYLNCTEMEEGFAICMSFEKFWKNLGDDWGPGTAKVWGAFLNKYPESFYSERAEWHRSVSSRIFYSCEEPSSGDYFGDVSTYTSYIQKFSKSKYKSKYIDYSNYFLARSYYALSTKFTPGGEKYDELKKDECERISVKFKLQSDSILKSLSESEIPDIQSNAKEILLLVPTKDGKAPGFRISPEYTLD
ncbi:hypothetical protein [Geothrix alkalitolerans]|uniref:hypothetical protein n=1 Tax=Geothrix alkalitolerans TaxID=2922724 RepID=UPI001FB04241|nr:hypothetical protein [Geothrix alkalitolerans]